MAKDRIGVAGPGRMGLAMVKHLIKHDYPVTVTVRELVKEKRANSWRWARFPTGPGMAPI